MIENRLHQTAVVTFSVLCPIVVQPFIGLIIPILINQDTKLVLLILHEACLNKLSTDNFLQLIGLIVSLLSV